jgi:hypothetical protein
MRRRILFDYFEHHGLVTARPRFLEEMNQKSPRDSGSARLRHDRDGSDA